MTRKPRSTPSITSWKELAAAVREWRKKNGTTQTEFAEAIGVSQPLVAQVEKGGPVSPLNVQRIAKKLAVDATSLLAADRSEPKSPLAFCGSTRCPNLRLAANDGDLFIAPLFHEVKKLSHETCPFCDLPLHRECAECAKPIHEKRLACPYCHQRFVQIPTSLNGLSNEALRSESDNWDERNRRIREYLGFE